MKNSSSPGKELQEQKESVFSRSPIIISRVIKQACL